MALISIPSTPYLNNIYINKNPSLKKNTDTTNYTTNYTTNDTDNTYRIDIHDNSHRKDAIIFRYKFTQFFMEELYKFSKIHQYDDRKSFKEAWEIWTVDQRDLITEEVSRLNNLGYNGDILDKMFKSARYYFRKKDITPQEPRERRKYISVHKDVLDAMDAHILSSMNFPDYKPSDGFANFCNTNIEELKSESSRLLENNLNSQEIIDKIKKTYKNRYFMAITK